MHNKNSSVKKILNNLQKWGIEPTKPTFYVGLAFNILILILFIQAINTPCLEIAQTQNGYCEQTWSDPHDNYCLIYNQSEEGYYINILDPNQKPIEGGLLYAQGKSS